MSEETEFRVGDQVLFHLSSGPKRAVIKGVGGPYGMMGETILLHLPDDGFNMGCFPDEISRRQEN